MVADKAKLLTNVLKGILRSLHADLLNELELSSTKHHCSLLHPCISVSKSSAFKSIHNFRLVAVKWNKVFLSTAIFLDIHVSQREPIPLNWATHIHRALLKSSSFGRYRVCHSLDNENVFVAYEFGGTGGCKESREVIIKAWKQREMYEKEYETEKKVYKTLSSTSPPMKGFPALIQATSDSDVHALVLEKLGPSLEDLGNLMRQHLITRFTEKMTLAVAIQMLDRYAALHERGITHNGVKPGNICLASPSSNPCTLNLIDFGFSFFRDEKLLTYGGEIFGNKRFFSTFSHRGYTQSQRDDLESLGYLFSALYQGSLPWDEKSTEEIWRLKMTTSSSELFRGMDSSFLEYWKDVRTLAFTEVPDYCSLKSRFVRCWERKKLGDTPGEYDWLELFNGLSSEGGTAEKKRATDDLLGITRLLSATTSGIALGPYN